ncbi:MAG: ATP-binding protein [Desulfobacteraceae bacterium]|nr:MAG: ATP-binding protein [Desulfobacteraceae bacterium]
MAQNEDKKDYYLLFIKQRIFTVTIVSLTPMILVSIIILYQFHTSYQEKVYAHLGTLVVQHKQNIDNFLREKLADIRFLAKNFNFDELADESFLRGKLENLQEEYDHVFVDLGVINSSGIQVAYAGPFKLGKAMYYTADWFEKSIKSGFVISDVFLGLRGLPHFIIAVREDKMGQPWILRATIDFATFNNLVENIRIGETGFAFILNKKAEFQTKPPLNVVITNGPYMDLMNNQNIAEDEIQIFKAADGAGNRNIYVSAFLKQGDWLLVCQQRASDAFSDFRRALNVAFIIIFLGSIATVSMAFIRWKRMVGSVEKTEQEKEMMNEQIIQTGKLASVGELAAGIAHEINNPVAIMAEEAGWIEDLLEEEEFQESENLSEFGRALKQIRAQGKRCKEITHKLLSFARKTDSRIQNVHLNELIEETVALSAQRAKYSNVTINMLIQENLPKVQVSQTELQQVLLNLINNALDAMEKTGGTLNIYSQLDDDHIHVKVEDNGPGIPEANLTRIFDPFFTTKQVGKGTGLGLSICYGIIKKLGGEIIVRSVIDGGTTFDVQIPLPVDEGGN